MSTKFGDAVPAAVSNAIQQGLLKAKFERALTGKRAYTMAATPEDVPARKGSTITLIRASGLAPSAVPVLQSGEGSKNSGLDNGLTPDQFATEQYTLTMREYMKTHDLNLMDDEAVIANQAFIIAGAQGEQAMSTLEILARSALLNAGMSGNTRVISGGTTNTTTAHVDDIRGFQTKLVNGVPTAVSASNKLSVSEIANGGGGVTQTLLITGVTADETNVSSAAAVGGISGQIVFDTATQPVVGDILIASNASEIVRPNGKRATHLLSAQDLFSTEVAADMCVVLENNGTPRFEDDDYLCFVSPRSHRQLLESRAFEKAYQSQYESDPHRKGVITSFQGVRYVKTNFAVRQNVGSGVSVAVERPIMVGKDALIRGDYEGLENFVRKKASSKVHEMMLLAGVIFSIRDALDRAGQNMAFTWDTIIDFQCPTDGGTTNAIVPTASNALYKRIAVCEHAG